MKKNILPYKLSGIGAIFWPLLASIYSFISSFLLLNLFFIKDSAQTPCIKCTVPQSSQLAQTLVFIYKWYNTNQLL